MRAAEIRALLEMGYKKETVQGFLKAIKGSVITIPASGNATSSFQLTGTARILLGFRTFDALGFSKRMTILINTEKIYDSVDENLTSVVSSVRDEYIETFRQLKGQDVINVEFTNSAGATDVNVMAFYLR